MTQQKNDLSVDDIIEVQHFMEVQAKYEEFKEKHSAVFAELQLIAEEYNTALESADKAVRAKQIACGPFRILNHSTRYDAEKLYEELGKDTFLNSGGVIKSKTIYDLDKPRFEAQVAANMIPAEVVEVVKSTAARYASIGNIVLP